MGYHHLQDIPYAYKFKLIIIICIYCIVLGHYYNMSDNHAMHVHMAMEMVPGCFVKKNEEGGFAYALDCNKHLLGHHEKQLLLQKLLRTSHTQFLLLASGLHPLI